MKDDRVYLLQMLDFARRIQKKMVGFDRNQFLGNEDLLLAVTHLLQNTGEAARRVSDATRLDLSAIPWKQIAGMRHRIVHDYLRVSGNIIWETAMRDIPMLIAQLESIEGERGSDSQLP